MSPMSKESNRGTVQTTHQVPDQTRTKGRFWRGPTAQQLWLLRLRRSIILHGLLPGHRFAEGIRVGKGRVGINGGDTGGMSARSLVKT